MSQRALCFITLTILIVAMTTNILGGPREHDGGASSGGIAAGVECTPPSYNRSVDGIGFRPNSTGGTDIDLEYSLLVGDTAGAAADLRADILVEIIVGGSVVSQTTIPAGYDFIGNDAVTCAVSCASPCGSIFGDGVCSGCDCDYSRSATLPGTVLASGDMVRATILPLAVAAPELRTDDDELEVTFGTPNSCCPGDLDASGVVNVVDFLILLANWGPCP
jgi:hypothetical protein